MNLDTTPATTGLTSTELSELESWLSEELHCESKHRHENTLCSHEVTHRADRACNGGRVLVCGNAAAWYERWMQCGMTCVGCFKPVRDCWTLTPV